MPPGTVRAIPPTRWSGQHPTHFNQEKIMASSPRPIAPCLWFDDRAEEAARFYVDVFKDARIVRVTRYGQEGHEIHGRPAGSVMTVDFELNGQPFTALNGGPVFTFNEAISFQVICEDQEELDHYWERLGDGGDPAAQQCGWLKDRFGVSWQVVPEGLTDLVSDPDSERSQRAMKVMLGQKKLDIRAIREAYEGAGAA
jgi:predicted 3-demethylubiquinone-9 3-methyltransferase (glyoxalase superfamily)